MKNLFLTLLLASLTFVSMANTKKDSTIVELKRTIQVLEDKQLLFDKAIELNKKEHSVDLKAQIETVKAQNTTFIVWGGIIAGLTFVGFLAFLYQLFIGAKKMATEEVRTQISVQIEREKELLTKLIDEKDLDTKIKKNMKIAVVHKTAINNDLDTTLKRLGFTYENKKEKEDLTGFDLIFIDNSQNEFGYKDKGYAPEFVKNHDNDKFSFFYYNEGKEDKKQFDNYSYQTKAQGFANSLSSLNHNLLDVMRYKWVVVDDKS
jgi:hypothetical protein